MRSIASSSDSSKRWSRPIVIADIPEASIRRFWSLVDSSGGPDACWLWRGAKHGATNSDLDYGVIYLVDRRYSAHRLMYTLVHGDIPHGMDICHTCDCPACANPAHLYAGTPKQNVADRQNRGRSNARKGRTTQAFEPKLTAKQVTRIRMMYGNGWSQRELARKFRVTQIAINYIVNRKTWKHLPDVGVQLVMPFRV